MYSLKARLLVLLLYNYLLLALVVVVVVVVVVVLLLLHCKYDNHCYQAISHELVLFTVLLPTSLLYKDNTDVLLISLWMLGLKTYKGKIVLEAILSESCSAFGSAVHNPST